MRKEVSEKYGNDGYNNAIRIKQNNESWRFAFFLDISPSENCGERCSYEKNRRDADVISALYF